MFIGMQGGWYWIGWIVGSNVGVHGVVNIGTG